MRDEHGFRRVAASSIGYDAVACPVQLVPNLDRFAEVLAETGLGYVPQEFSFGSDVGEHLAMARDALEQAARLDPHHVVGRLGADRWDAATAVAFLREVQAMATDLGLHVAHETHRSRILFNPWTAEAIITSIDDLAVAVDLSHWTCVTESLGLPGELIGLLAERAVHVDCRVGHEEGPQVPDPRTDLAARHFATFEGWWDVVWRARVAAGEAEQTLMPEFGPPPYQPVHPADGRPLADVNDVDDWMAARLVERYRH